MCQWSTRSPQVAPARWSRKFIRLPYPIFSTISSRHYFFFQAEDGIRASSVTGVQTCALPIFAFPSARGVIGQAPFVPFGAEVEGAIAAHLVHRLGDDGVLKGRLVDVAEVVHDDRSEERRVGKE